jgi:hypothetical protein
MDISLIESSEERLRLAMIASNIGELEQLLSPDLVFTTFLGELIFKAQDLEAHASGYLRIHSITISDRLVSIRGELAVVSCAAKIDATFDGDRNCKDFRFTRVWASDETGAPQVIAGQATLVYASLDL